MRAETKRAYEKRIAELEAKLERANDRAERWRGRMPCARRLAAFFSRPHTAHPLPSRRRLSGYG